MKEERCVICGEIIPEGRMVCPKCEEPIEENATSEIKISLKTFKEINDFVKIASMCRGEVLVHSQRYIINGKSIMGMHSLDLSKPITVEFQGEIPIEVTKRIEKYIV